MVQASPTHFIADAQALVNRPGAQFPAARVVRNLSDAALASKLVKAVDTQAAKRLDENSDTGMVSVNAEQISKTIVSRIEDNENIARLFPDIELAIQIIISSILSPKDMFKWDLIFRTKESRFPAVLTAKLNEVVRQELNNEYDLLKEQPEILRDALFRVGSAVKLVLPESAVDQLINRQRKITTESIYSEDIFVAGSASGSMKIRHLGLLGSPHQSETKPKIASRLALESIFQAGESSGYNPSLYVDVNDLNSDFLDKVSFKKLVQESVEVHDNYHLLKMPELARVAAEERVKELTGSRLSKMAQAFVTESYHMFEAKASEKKQLTPAEVQALLYKNGSGEYVPFVKVPSKDSLTRRSVGRPLVMRLPSESVIPVFVPGNPKDHVGYFVLTTADGNFLTADSVNYDSGQGLSSMLKSDQSNTSLSSLLTEKARRNLGNDGIVPMLSNITELYAEIVERDLMERLAKGSYGRHLRVGRNNEIYRIMMARALKNQMTRLIYIPVEYVTYFAFDYHRNGVGSSYLDDLSNITSLRAMVLFSKVMQKVKSSIAITKVNVELDPRDPDPQKTMEMATHLVAKARQQYFPHGLNRVADLTDWIQRAGIEMTFEGHPRLPSTKFNFEAMNFPHAEADDELDEMFRHQTYMHFGLSPETVDSAAKADFATTIQNQSILFARRIMMLSNRHSENITDYGRKLITNDEVIQKRLLSIMQEHKADLEKILTDEEKAIWLQNEPGFIAYLLQSYIDVLEIDLPKPDSTKVENLKTALQAQEEMVDKALDYIFSRDVLPEEIGGEASNYVDNLKAVWKSMLMRKWMSENNYATDAFDIIKADEDGKPMVDLLSGATEHAKMLMLNIANMLKEMQKTKAASDADLNKIGAEVGEGGSDSSESGNSDGGNDDLFGDVGNNPFDNPEASPEDEPSEEPADESVADEEPAASEEKDEDKGDNEPV